MRFLGDIVVVEHIESNVQSSILIIPDLHRENLAAIKARVLAIGYVSPDRRKLAIKRRKLVEQTTKPLKHFASDSLQVGDIVYVPEHLGTRGRVKENPKAIIYDTVDVLAKVEEETPIFGEAFSNGLV